MAAVIDLGEVGQDPADPAGHASPPGGKPRPARPPWMAGRGRQWWPAAAVSVALLLAGTAAVPSPHGPTLTPLFAVPAGPAVATDERMYVLGPGPVAGEVTVTAYGLDDGAELWQRSIPSTTDPRAASPLLSGLAGQVPRVDVLAGVPVVTVGAGWASDRAGQVPRSRATALHPDGRVRWTREGEAWREAVDGDVLLLERRASGEVMATAVDPRTGQHMWNIDIAGSFALVDGDAERLAVLSTDDVLRTYDVTTGAPLATTTVPALGGIGVVAAVAVIGSRVYLDVPEGVERLSGTRKLVAHEADHLTHQWTVTLERSSGNLGYSPIRTCGELICLVSAGRLHALDPATGAAAFPPVAPASRADTWTVAGLPGGEHLLLASAVDPLSSWIVDAATGQRVRELTGWRAAGDDGPWQAGAGPALPLLFHRDPHSGTTSVGVLRAGSLDVDPLGTVGGVGPTGCTAGARHLICVDDGPPRQLRVWRTG